MLQTSLIVHFFRKIVFAHFLYLVCKLGRMARRFFACATITAQQNFRNIRLQTAVRMALRRRSDRNRKAVMDF